MELLKGVIKNILAEKTCAPNMTVFGIRHLFFYTNQSIFSQMKASSFSFAKRGKRNAKIQLKRL